MTYALSFVSTHPSNNPAYRVEKLPTEDSLHQYSVYQKSEQRDATTIFVLSLPFLFLSFKACLYLTLFSFLNILKGNSLGITHFKFERSNLLFYTFRCQAERRTTGLDILERRHWAAILFIMGPSNALRLTEKLRKQDGGAHDFAPSMPPL